MPKASSSSPISASVISIKGNCCVISAFVNQSICCVIRLEPLEYNITPRETVIAKTIRTESNVTIVADKVCFFVLSLKSLNKGINNAIKTKDQIDIVLNCRAKYKTALQKRTKIIATNQFFLIELNILVKNISTL